MGLLDEVMDRIDKREGAAETDAGNAAETEEKAGAFEYGNEFAARYGKRKGSEKKA